MISKRRSKTDQVAAGEAIGIPYGPNPSTCPVRAVDAWCQAARLSDGALFRPVDRHGRMFFQILGAIAEFEHALMSGRTRDGLEAARSRGRTGGQKPKLTPRQAKIAQQMHDEVDHDGRRVNTVQQIADEFAVTRPTIYRHLDRQTG